MKRYTVERGDSLWKIAQNHNISLESLIAANPQIADPNLIQIGSLVNIPELWDQPGYDEKDYRAGFVYCDESEERPCIYVADEGETLESIGRQLHVPLSQLIYYNLRYGKREPLAKGARVVIPENRYPYPEQRPRRPR